MTPKPSSSLIQQRINPISGESEWVLFTPHEEEDGENGDDDDDDEGERKDEEDDDRDDHHPDSFLFQTSYLDMLNDTERNQAFEAAIQTAIASSSSPLRILDIGAGTGLLSMMAAKALQETFPLCTLNADKPITACESFLPMFQLARKVISLNGLSSFVHLVHKRSDEMDMGSDMASQADILVSEILDSTLLGEGLIPTLQHAHDHLLKPNACVVPHKATIYAQLVQCDFLWRQHDLYGVERQLADGLVLHPPRFKERSSLKPMQYPMHVDPLIDKLEVMSSPFKVFEFDFSMRPDGFGEVEIPVKTIKTGIVHAIISWWVLELDEKGLILYSTAPKWIHKDSGRSWHDHWKQCVWFVSGRGLHVAEETVLTISASHDSISFTYDEISYPKTSGYSSSLRTINHDFWKWTMKPERIGLLGSSKWRSTIMGTIKKLVHHNSSYTCLVVDDSLPLIISVALASSSTTVVSLLPGMQSSGSKVLEYLLEANSLSSDRVKFVRKQVKELSLEDINMKKVDILIGEPYYQISEDMLPWRTLRFWKERTLLNPLLSEKFITIPYKGMLRGMAISMHDFWKSRRALKTVQGFDHSAVNEMFGACGDLPKPLEGPILPCFLWQCGTYQELTEPFTIMTFDFLKTIEDVKGSTKVQISKSGTCHGIALWIDWVLDAECSEIVCTKPQGGGPTQGKQGVKLLSSPVEVEEFRSSCGSCSYNSILDLSATFNSSIGELDVIVNFV